MNIPDEAVKRFPPSMAVDNLDGTDYYVDDEWGYDDLQRKAFVAGAEWARKEALREAAVIAERMRMEWWSSDHVEMARGAAGVRHLLHALAEGDN